MDRKDTLLNYFDTVDDSNLTVVVHSTTPKIFSNKLLENFYLFFIHNILSEVLAEYSLDSDDIDSIPLFELQIHEIQDDNEIFKRCMKEILGRLCSYGTLQLDSVEAMYNEYVVALLHASIHIVMNIINKELSIRPQYGIVGEEN
ncbi:14703_t:CDS:2 [Funneliformis caledonium]|uniref:14703_t:CDS:1 n=1 Tax=Funneliformis caledonium TaxID=1117310 RepID=A0A9N9AQL4_9GLOM|nr:14703_t:CDS:2 [Funneliformis caledonium]